MLQKLGDHIADCLARATDAERRAAEATNEEVRLDNETLARSWRNLARSYQFVESLERFLLDARKGKAAVPPEPPAGPGLMFRPPGNVFEPDTIAVLTEAYARAIEGRPTSVHGVVAKCIIELASDGERDPDKLCQGALALCMTRMAR